MNNVKIYGRAGCQPCKAALRLIGTIAPAASLTYLEVDYLEPGWVKLVREELDGQPLPLIIIEDVDDQVTVIRGFQPDQIRAALT